MAACTLWWIRLETSFCCVASAVPADVSIASLRAWCSTWCRPGWPTPGGKHNFKSASSRSSYTCIRTYSTKVYWHGHV